MKQIKKVGVLGAGVMGSQIAMHLVNAGFKVILMDLNLLQLIEIADKLTEEKKIPHPMTILGRYLSEEEMATIKNPEIATDPQVRNRIILKNLQDAKAIKPAPLALTEFVDLIDVGNFTDDLEKLKEVDWIIEVILEDLKEKQDLMKRVAEVRKPGTIVSSNTSGISLNAIAEGLPEKFKQHFLGTHFFNPPRYLQLVEITPIETTHPEVLDYMRDFCDRKLGKTVVMAKDTPDFIANRIAVPGVMKIIQVMLEDGYSIEEIDKMTGKAIGWEKSATFGTLDIVGLNVFRDVVDYLYKHIPNDPYRESLKIPEFVNKMIEKGFLGRKAKKGFYQMVKKEDGSRELMVIDPETLEYRSQQKIKFASIETAKNIEDVGERIKFLFNGKDKVAEFLQKTLLATLVYAAERLPEIANDIVAVDTALKNGFLWKLGPFEVWDAIGVENVVEKLNQSKQPIPTIVEDLLKSGNKSFYQKKEGKTYFFDFKEKNLKEKEKPEGIIVLKDLKEQNKVLKENNEASLIDLGDGVACLEFHTKMNAIGPGTISMMKTAAKEITENPEFKGLVISNQGDNFSAGANLDLVKEAILNNELEEVELMAKEFQDANMGFKYMPKPVVAAPFGFTFGGGCEVCLHADKICAAHETYIGLVEFAVGVIPAAGGTKETLLRNLERIPRDWPPGIEIDTDPLPFIARALFTVIRPDIKVAASAFAAKQVGHLREDDMVVMNKNRLIAEAKAQVLALARNYQPPRPKKITLYGQRVYTALKAQIYIFKEGGFMSEYDALIAEKLAEIMTGGNLSQPTEVSEQYLLDQERKVFMFLCQQKKTQERIAHMLKTGKTLRN